MTYKLPKLETKHKAPNYTPAARVLGVFKRRRTIEEILIHWWDLPERRPTFDGTVNWLARKTTQASAHRIVEDGRRAKMVDDNDVAWHAGSVANPKSIAIEGNPRRSAGDYAAMAAEVAEIRHKRGDIPLKLHKQYMNTTCSGWDLGRIDREADAYTAAKWGKKKAPVKPPKGTTTAAGVYTVSRGDTLGEIATKHRTSVKALQLLNGISNPNRIKTGQKIYTRWIVARGQTLGSIAAIAGTTAATLARLNSISNPNRIKTGQALRLP